MNKQICPDPSEFQKLATGELAADESARLLNHIENCDSCRDEVASLVDTSRADPDFPETDVVGGEGLATPRPENLEHIGEYRILNVIAVHGQGIVYRADHPHLNRQVVIKANKDPLRPEHHQAIIAEGQALASVAHPNLAKVYDLQFHDNCPYLVLEYIEGRNLAEILKDRQFDAREACEFVAILSRAIHAAHQLGIVHRDLKPANVVIRASDQTPKIIDFGLARARTAYTRDETDSQMGGTIAYMAPEQAVALMDQDEAVANELDERADVFSLGAILFELLAGRPLYSFSNALSGLEMARSCDYDVALLDGVPAAIRAVCRRAIAPNPAERWRTAEDLAAALEPATKPRLTAAAVFAASTCCIAVTALLWIAATSSSRPSNSHNGENVANSNKDDDPPALENGELFPGVRLIHFSNENGELSQSPLFAAGTPVVGDKMTVEIEFERPTYSFLIAVNPDRGVQLCPDDDARSVPQNQPSKQIRYHDDNCFVFSDGAGQQLFVLIESPQPLPAFDEWVRDLDLPSALPKRRGRWLWSDGEVSLWSKRKERGSGSLLDGSEAFADAMRKIEELGEQYTVRAVCFPVDAVASP